jgi:tetratricopeptide (TPR) repeat protein
MLLPRQQWAGISFVLVLAAIVIWPSIQGGFVYDDHAFIVNNAALRVTTLDLADWAAAADSFPANHQGRWLGMLSFAANHYIGGLDPWGYKLANLLIHLFNGWLVWLTLRALFLLTATVHGRNDRNDRLKFDIAAAFIAAAWLVLPINFTAAQYVIQRLESLSNTFVLIGLLLYLRLRLRDWNGESVGARLPFVIFLATGIGFLVKESAILLPLYVACVEVCVLNLRNRDGRYSRPMLVSLVICLCLPLILGLYWLSTWIGTERSYSRAYDTAERLMTQARILWKYVHWALLPNLGDLTLYHDDIAVSRSWLSPWTTPFAIAAIIASIGMALLIRGRYPLTALGIVWFFAGHSLTATVIPLMLAFEHRNYFPTIGLLLALVSLLSLEGRILRSRIQIVLPLIILGYYGMVTHLRAREWSDPVRLATSEFSKRPDSVDARYNYAQELIRASGYDAKSELTERAMRVFVDSRGLPGAGLLFDSAVLVVRARRGEPQDPGLWDSMATTVRNNPPRTSDASSLLSIFQCMQSKVCAPEYDELREVIEIAMKHPQSDATLYVTHAWLVYLEFHDLDAALQTFELAERRIPGEPVTFFNRGLMLASAGRLDDARADLHRLEEMDFLGSHGHLVGPLRDKISDARVDAPQTMITPATPQT